MHQVDKRISNNAETLANLPNLMTSPPLATQHGNLSAVVFHICFGFLSWLIAFGNEFHYRDR